MPLTWDLTDVADYQDLYDETGETGEDGKPLVRLNPITEGLIFLTISIGLGSWTRENASEVYARLKLLEKLDGCTFYRTTQDGRGREDRPITPEDVLRHVGIKTNVSATTRTQFLNQQRRGLGQIMDSHVRAEEFKAVTA